MLNSQPLEAPIADGVSTAQDGPKGYHSSSPTKPPSDRCQSPQRPEIHRTQEAGSGSGESLRRPRTPDRGCRWTSSPLPPGTWRRGGGFPEQSWNVLWIQRPEARGSFPKADGSPSAGGWGEPQLLGAWPALRGATMLAGVTILRVPVGVGEPLGSAARAARSRR
jgi:hypothetical protein